MRMVYLWKSCLILIKCGILEKNFPPFCKSKYRQYYILVDEGIVRIVRDLGGLISRGIVPTVGDGIIG